MKRLMISFLMILFILGTLNGQETAVVLETSYFMPSDQAFKDIYGSGIQVGGEFHIDVMRRTSIWIGASYFSKEGELTYTKEEATLKIIPVYLGVCYRFTEEKIIPYLGIGMGIHFYREIASLYTIEYARFGLLAQTGVLMKLARKFYLELEVNYSYCRINPDDTGINIGGIGAGIGLKYRLK